MESAQTYTNYESGDIIMTQGEVGNCAYLIEEGQVELLVAKADGVIEHLSMRGPGSIIGETAILNDAPRTTTVKAIDNCKLVEILRKDFNCKLDSADPIIRAISEIILGYHDSIPPSANSTQNIAEQNNDDETRQMANDFEVAIKSNQLQLHYQPIIDFQTSDLKGFEALMRWKHPEQGMIPPGIFIPVAEDSGLIVQASRWALRESCQALKRIQGQTGYDFDLTMSVNFSSNDFAEESFLEQVYLTLSETDISPSRINLEITEQLLMMQHDNAKETLSMCRQAGLGISVDDFGTGYSALDYLHHYPIDALKIDQAFVRNMRSNDSARALIKSIIALGKNMKIKTIAEGVEDLEDAQTLKEMGCDQTQGYYFSKPLPEHEVVQFVRNWDINPLRSSF